MVKDKLQATADKAYTITSLVLLTLVSLAVLGGLVQLVKLAWSGILW